MARGDARSTTTSARSTTRRVATVLDPALRSATAAPPTAQRETLDDPRRGSFARPASARTSPTSSSRACPACRRKAATGSSPRARFILHRMPTAIRTVCLEFFGQVRDSVPSIVEIKQLSRRASGGGDPRRARAPRRALRQGGRLRDQGQAPRAAEDGADRRHRRATTRTRSRARPREVVRIANARGAEGFVAVSAETRKKFWLDRARTAAIAKHTNAFKINEDVVIPLERLGDYTDGIERINIELSIAQQARARRRARRVLRGRPSALPARRGAPAADC